MPLINLDFLSTLTRATFAVVLMLPISLPETSASSIKQRMPIQQENLRREPIPQKPPVLPQERLHGTEEELRGEAEALYNFYRYHQSMTHQQAIDVLDKANFPTSHIVAK